MLTVAPAWRSFLTTLELPEKDAIISAVFPFWRWRKRGGDTKLPIWGYFVSVVFKCGMDNAIVTQVEGLSAKAKFLYNSKSKVSNTARQVILHQNVLGLDVSVRNRRLSLGTKQLCV